MRLGLSLLLIGAGAILRWATTGSVSGLNLHVVGLIWMVIGALGVALTLVVWVRRRRGLRGRAPSEDERHHDERGDRAA
jgi:hypothetical protein